MRDRDTTPPCALVSVPQLISIRKDYMEEATPKPKVRHRPHQDWITAFDRDLIRAAQKKLPVTFCMADREEDFTGYIIQVDAGFVKVDVGGSQVWFNKDLMSDVTIGDENDESN